MINFVSFKCDKLKSEHFYRQVAKNRYSGDLGVMILDFDKVKLSYAQKKKVKSEEVKDLKEIEKAHTSLMEN